MAAKRALSPAQTRERRAKIAAAVLGVVFLGVAGIQGPKLMKELSGKPAATVAESAISGDFTSGTAALAGQPVAAGQLTHFSRFGMKDPFHALVKATTPGETAATGASGKLGVVSPPGSPAVTFSQAPGATAPGGPVVPAALILYNGKKQIVVLGGTFPVKAPVFRLVSLSLKAVKIGLVGGSFANGKTTLLLPRGRKITLANSNTGSRFILRLLKLTTAPKPQTLPPAVGGVGAAAASTTPATTTTTAAPSG